MRVLGLTVTSFKAGLKHLISMEKVGDFHGYIHAPFPTNKNLLVLVGQYFNSNNWQIHSSLQLEGSYMA